MIMKGSNLDAAEDSNFSAFGNTHELVKLSA